MHAILFMDIPFLEIEAADLVNASSHNLIRFITSNQGPLDGVISRIMLCSSSLLLWLRVLYVDTTYVSLPDFIFLV
jgi:hypothetical protein